MIFEAFVSDGPGQPLKHLGAIEAPSGPLARIYATQIYGRRGEGGEICVVSREALVKGASYERPFAHHALRRVDGYSISERLEQVRRRTAAHV
jgi:1,2-phenylacetyl-CoA epoxidase PaaB subunit